MFADTLTVVKQNDLIWMSLLFIFILLGVAWLVYDATKDHYREVVEKAWHEGFQDADEQSKLDYSAFAQVLNERDDLKEVYSILMAKHVDLIQNLMVHHRLGKIPSPALWEGMTLMDDDMDISYRVDTEVWDTYFGGQVQHAGARRLGEMFSDAQPT